MKSFILTFLVIHSSVGYSQSNFEGKYRDYFGYSIEFKNDRTFEFNYHFDLASGWAIGTWNLVGDTINLEVTPILDTLTRGNQSDSLVLSLDQIPQRISIEQFAVDQITSGGQLPKYAPTKLLYRKEHLYEFDKKGKLKKKKIKGLFTNKKFPPWYFRVDQ